MIPKIFHQIWVGPNPIPATAGEYAATWMRHHPTWELRLWTDANVPALRNEEVYRQTSNWGQRSDILRQEILSQYGGVYLDVDFECLRNIEALIENADYFYGDERPGTPAIGILGSTAGHPFARWCVQWLPELFPWTPGRILQETGPGFSAEPFSVTSAQPPSRPAKTRCQAVMPEIFWRLQGTRLCSLSTHGFFIRITSVKSGIQRSTLTPMGFTTGNTTGHGEMMIQYYRVGTDDTNFVIPELIERDMYRVALLVRALRHARGEILDCGAHIGTFSVLLASHGVQQPIKAFEPEPENYQLLVENTRAFPTITPIQEAVGVQDETRPLLEGGGTGRWSFAREGAGRTILVKVQNLFRLIREIEYVALLKLDLEGYEATVLNNMPADVLRKVHLLVIEEHHVAIDYARLRENGFWSWFHPFEMASHGVYRADRPWGEGKTFVKRKSRNDVKILVIANVDALRRRMDKSCFYRYEALARQNGVTLTGNGCAGFTQGMPVRELFQRWGKPDFIYHGVDVGITGRPLVDGLRQCEVPRALELIDTWSDFEKQESFLREEGFDYGFHTPRPWEGGYEAYCPDVRFVWTPNAIRTDVYKDYGLKKEIDILFYGTVAPFYPFGQRVVTILQELARRSQYVIHIIPHPGYGDAGYVTAPSHYVGEVLAREINRAWITIADGSSCPSLFAKHLEIAASLSVVAGTMPDQARPYFGRGFIDLSSLSDGEIMRTLASLLEAKEELVERARAGRESVTAHFSVDGYAEKFLDLVCRLLGKDDL